MSTMFLWKLQLEEKLKKTYKISQHIKKLTEDTEKLIYSLFYMIDASVVQNPMENPERWVQFPTSTLQNCSIVDVLHSLKNWDVVVS